LQVNKGQFAMETKEQKRRNFERAVAINALGGGEPSKEFVELMEKYIEGEISLEQIRKIILDKYRQKE